MRVLMLNNEFPPLGGGTGTVNREILKRLAAVPGMQIDLITSALGKNKEVEEFAPGVRIFKLPVNNKNIHHSSNRELLTYAAQALPVSIRLHSQQRYEVCLAWSAVPAGGVACILGTMIGLPYFVRVCGPDIPGFEQRYGPLYPVLTPVIRCIWRKADKVIAKCEGEAQMIHAVDRRVEVTLVPNGVDLDAFQPGEAIPDVGPLRLICVARLIERKGQRHLIEAVKRLVDEGLEIILELVGEGDALPEYQRLVLQSGLQDRIRFMGYVPREQIAGLYAQAHVFVLASYNEGMSVATLEALASGLPVVVTRTGGTADLVQEEVNGLTFTWGDVEQLAAHLRRFYSDRAKAREMGKSSRQLAQQFTWSAAVERYNHIFKAALANHAD